jgi:HK97 family phage major capsid protein
MLNIAQLERDVEAKKKEGLALLERTMTTAETENRVMTAEETAAIQTISAAGLELQNKIASLKGGDAMRKQLEALTGGAGNGNGPARVLPFKSLGQQFVEAEGMTEFFKDQKHRTSAVWRSPSVEVFDTGRGGLHATTLTEDPASGGQLVVPQYLPGILPVLTRPLLIADLLASGTTVSNLLTYMKETAFVNAAGSVLEGAAKPESALTFVATSDPVRKLATFMPVSEEMLEDVPAIRSYIDSRLVLFVQIVEENQLLNGSGVAPDILGITKRAGLAPAFDITAAPGVSNAEGVFIQAQKIYWSSFLMPTGIIMNPGNWAVTALLKTTTGEYLGGGPFVQATPPQLWGLPIAVTPAQAAGTCWIGAFNQACQIFRRGGFRVEASNSHQDFFVKNLVAIRAEERLALCVYRPGAIGSVINMTGTPIPLGEETPAAPTEGANHPPAGKPGKPGQQHAA